MQKCLRRRKLGSITFQEATLLRRAEGKGSEGFFENQGWITFSKRATRTFGDVTKRHSSWEAVLAFNPQVAFHHNAAHSFETRFAYCCRSSDTRRDYKVSIFQAHSGLVCWFFFSFLTWSSIRRGEQFLKWTCSFNTFSILGVRYTKDRKKASRGQERFHCLLECWFKKNLSP